MIDETVFNQVIGDLFYDKRQEALARTALVRYLGALDHAQRQERVIRLAVPYISQWVADPENPDDDHTAAASTGDCGPACAAMLIHYATDKRPTVDQVAAACQQKPGSKSTHIWQVIMGLRAYGLSMARVRGNYRLERVLNELEAGKPLIVLVKYSLIPGRQDVGYKWSHFMVVVGFDYDTREFLVHDPDWRGANAAKGAYFRVAWADLDAAFAYDKQNQPYQGILI